jgi:hypothetical protein
MTMLAELMDAAEKVLPSPPPAVDRESDAETAVSDARRVWFIGAIRSHEVAELDAIAVYRDLATRASDPVIAGLLRVLLRDEQRHHGILQAIGMQSGAAARHAPPGDQDPTADSLTLLNSFARQERDGADELRRLARQAPELVGDVFSLLLELMAMDSLKHERILSFIARELKPDR